MRSNQQRRWPSEQTDKTSYKTCDGVLQTHAASEVLNRESTIDEPDQKNIDRKEDIGRLLNKVSKNFDANAPKHYEISDDFDFDRLAETDAEIEELFNRCDSTILKKAQNSLWNKRYGQRLTIRQIISWIEQEGKY